MSMELHDDYIEVESLSIRAGKALSTDGELGTIVDWLDDEGDDIDMDCADMEEVSSCVVEWPSGGFSVIDLCDYEFAELIH